MGVGGEQAIEEVGDGHLVLLLNERLSHRLIKGHDVPLDWLYTIH
ncbi:hypothetical protein YSA_03858 [Pseudomonas putida ND6]|uniref:Uncharacterized protein n=1 Tax=Pseudomonas putida ND6 TaxID=231023 RepID=I3UTN4_PSEPU|nr:hypothetical protein YSA_03858 [Pseudomonas putida ND6]